MRNNAQSSEADMKLSQREKQIMEILKQKRYSSVKNLAKETYISQSSVRRDLAHLEALGLVERSYGGVSISGSESEVPHLNARITKNLRAKRKIAQKAIRFVKDGMTVLLDGSTTAYQLVDLLAAKKNITLITNATYTAQRAIEKGITVYLTGGRSEGGSPVLTGSYAEEMLERINADVVFFSSMALTDEGVVCDCTESENKIRRIMLCRAKTKILLMDKSKIGKSAQHVLCTLNELTAMITED